MRVKLTTDRAGGGNYQQEGEVIDLPDAEAARLIDAKQAEPAEADKPTPKPKRK